jgi:hypothetical protein
MLQVVLRRDLVAEHLGLLGKLQVARVLRHAIAAYLDPVGPRSTGPAVPCRLLVGRKPVSGS